MFVCLVFCEVVSQFPISGGLYPWARRLVGKRWAWMAGWIYGWALLVSIAAVATGGAPFVAQLLGFPVTPTNTTAHGAGDDRARDGSCNVSGTRLLARVAMFGFICELIGAIAVGGYLLLVCAPSAVQRALRHVLHSQRAAAATYPAFLASALAAMFCYYGFEACGDVAEETPNASRMIPKAMRMTIYVGGAAAMLVCVALILAVPDMNAILSGKDTDPVATISALGHGRDRLSRRAGRRSGVVHLLLPQHAGCREPSLVRLRARPDDRRQQAPEPHLAAHACTRGIVGAGGR